MAEVDARGLRCPWPVLKASRALRDGAALPLDILADDTNAEAELTALAKYKGLKFEKLENGHFQLF